MGPNCNLVSCCFLMQGSRNDGMEVVVDIKLFTIIVPSSQQVDLSAK